MKNKEKEPLLLRIIYAILNVGAFIYVLAGAGLEAIKRIPKKLDVYKEKGIDFWYKHVLKKERPSKYLETKEYVGLIKDEVYKVWPQKEMLDLLAKNGTSLENVVLPKEMSKEDLYELYVMSREMSHRYMVAAGKVMDKIRNLELDCEVVYHRKYVKKKATRREALMIDELLALLEELKSEPYECEVTEEQESEITVEKVEKTLNNMDLYMELSAIYLPSVISQADLQKAINRMEELLANPPSRKTA